MHLRAHLVLLLLAAPLLGPALAQGQLCSTSHTTALYCLIPTAFHTQAAPFNALFTPLGTELSELPTARPAGLVLRFEHGLPVAANESLGAIFSERAEALGRHRVFLGFTYQFFRFSSIDGNDLSSLPIVLFLPSQDTYTVTRNRFDVKTSQFTAVAAVGLTDRIDLSAAVPFERVSLAVRVTGTEYGLGNATATVNEFVPGSSSGLADTVVGIKFHGLEQGGLRLAAGLDGRIPSGDELNFLGSGTYGLRPYVAFSGRGRIAPHINLGYQFNGKSILNASTSGAQQRLPNNLVFSAGANFEVAPRWTVVADLLGREFFNAPRLSDPQLIAIPTSSIGTAPSVQPYTGSFSTSDLSLAVKAQLFHQVIFTASSTLQLNVGGLRAKVVPLAGLSYNF